nr:hypothetical protein [Pandoravirus massiliensis]
MPMGAPFFPSRVAAAAFDKAKETDAAKEKRHPHPKAHTRILPESKKKNCHNVDEKKGAVWSTSRPRVNCLWSVWSVQRASERKRGSAATKKSNSAPQSAKKESVQGVFCIGGRGRKKGTKLRLFADHVGENGRCRDAVADALRGLDESNTVEHGLKHPVHGIGRRAAQEGLVEHALDGPQARAVD